MISLLFLSCKRFHLLERTIASIRAHLRDVEPTVQAEFLCFDNGSAPEDQRRMLDLGMDLVQASAKNLGIGPAMNRLIGAVRTPYVLNLQDDWVVRNPDRIPFIAEAIRICESDRRIAHVKLDTCHFLDFSNRQVYDGPFTAPGASIPFFVQNPTMLWGGFSFPPAITRTEALHHLGPFREDQPFRRGWAESEFSGRFTSQQFVAAKSPRMLVFDHIGGEQASPGWEDANKTTAAHAQSPSPLPSPTAQHPQGEQLITRGERDRRALERHLPDLPAVDDVLTQEEWLLFQRIHQAYCTSVSTAEMAASLEAIRFTCQMIVATKPKTVADLGSGLSSVLLRWFIRAHAPEIDLVTADSEATWLRKTGEFIAQQGLPSDNLLLWDDLRSSGRTFDLIFYDLGHVHELRSTALAEVLAMTTANGYVIADDVHFVAYRHVVEQQAAAAGRTLYNCLSFTRYRFQRFSALIAPPIAMESAIPT